MQSTSKTRRTLASYLDDYLQRGDAIVFVQRRGLRYVRWSYQQLVLAARRTARKLESRGIAKGDRILLCGESSPEWVAAFWGCLLRGAVIVPLDKDSTEGFFLAVQQQTEAKFIFAGSEVSVLERLAERLNIPLLLLDELTERIASHSAAPYPREGVDENTLVEIIYTSGTTSTPKGVLLTHRNLLANLLPLETEIAKYIKWERFVHPVRFLNLVPLSHVFGQFMGVFVPQLLGGEVHFHDTLNPAEVVRRTRASRISVLVLVPRMLETLREWVERNHALDNLDERIARAEHAHFLRRWWMFRDVHRQFGWKFWAFLSGGATLDERTETFWRRLGFAVLQGYGMTETASLITVTHPFKGGHGSIGKLMPGYEVKLDEAGEIIVRGDSVSPGYWSAAGSINRDVGEWLHTGDIGAMDEAGNLYFKGRKGDVIVTAAGLNIYPEDLEEALNRQPEVRASCVISWSGVDGTEPVAPLAVVILRDSATSGTAAAAAAAAAIERANQSLTEYQKIRHWHIWTEPDFPRTATHKILKREVAERIKDSGQKPERKEGLPRSTPSSVTPHPSSFIPDPSSFSSLDSMGRIELLSALEERYQIEIDEAAFTAATTVEEIEQLVRGEMRGAHADRAGSPDRGPQGRSAAGVAHEHLGWGAKPGEAQVRGAQHLDRLPSPILLSPITLPEITVPASRNPKSEIRNPKFPGGTPYPYPKWSRRFPLTWLRVLLFYMIILPITRVMSRMRVEGSQCLESLAGPVLFVANHVTLADHALILAALPPRLRHRLAIAMEGERLRDWLHPAAGTSWFMRLRLLAQYVLVTTFFPVFPLPKQSGFRRSFAYAGECVDRGDSVLVFPEGERAPRGQLHMSPFRPGIGLLAKELNVTVVPIKLHGLYELKRRQQYFAPPGMVTVVFSEPLKFDTRLKPAAIAEELQRRLESM